MAVAVLNDFDLVRGDSIDLQVVFVDDAEPPQPIDISNRTLIFTIKSDYNDPDTAKLGQARVTFPANADSVNGIGYLFVPHTETESLTIGEEVWCDFQQTFTDAHGNLHVNTLEAFKKTVQKDVTKGVT